jgi:hypothetical protein
MEIVKSVCMSGGAEGADSIFGACALAAGHDLVHFTFKNHKLKFEKDNKQLSYIHVLTQDELNIADEYLIQANEVVGRKFPSSSLYVNNLLRRNYYQIKDSDACYAVSKIEQGKIAGGTAWATAMFVVKNNFNACPCYVFCQITEKWHEWSGTNWNEIISPPKFKDGLVYAGIGSRRDIVDAGTNAILELYE